MRLHRETLVWLILMVATAASWWMGTSNDQGALSSVRWSTMALLGIAFIKTYLVLQYFMELVEAPKAMRVISAVWAFGSCLLVSALISASAT